MNFNLDLQTYYLKPAEFCFVRKASLIRTVLGSCVSVTMFHQRTGAAAACHPVLPVCRETNSCRPAKCRQKYKYVECVIPEMIRHFTEIGVQPDELEVKLFGGAHMFSKIVNFQNMDHVGSMNVSMARQKLAELEIVLKSHDVGGTEGRKIYFDTRAGDVWLKRFRNDTAGRDEQKAVQDQITIQMHEYAR